MAEKSSTNVVASTLEEITAAKEITRHTCTFQTRIVSSGSVLPRFRKRRSWVGLIEFIAQSCQAQQSVRRDGVTYDNCVEFMAQFAGGRPMKTNYVIRVFHNGTE